MFLHNLNSETDSHAEQNKQHVHSRLVHQQILVRERDASFIRVHCQTSYLFQPMKYSLTMQLCQKCYYHIFRHFYGHPVTCLWSPVWNQVYIKSYQALLWHLASWLVCVSTSHPCALFHNSFSCLSWTFVPFVLFPTIRLHLLWLRQTWLI